MPKFNLISGILALSLFSYAQFQGWNMFDSVANPGGSRGARSGHIYHK